MKKNQIIIIFLVFTSINLFAQDKLEFKIGTEYRITPIYKSLFVKTITPDLPLYFNMDRQLTGTAFNYSVTKYFKSGFGFGLSQSFHYTHLYYDVKHLSEEVKINESVKRVVTDFKLFLVQEFYINDKTFFVEFGGSLMNYGSSFSTPWGDDNFNFFTTNLTIGLVYNNLDVGFGTHYTNGSSNYSNTSKIFIPYLKLNYILGKNN